MHYTFRNVNFAFRQLVADIHEGNVPTRCTSSRAGNVIQVDEPVLITYTHPLERVLFNEARDANPFFHLFESLWMLAGRNDVAPLLKYNSNIGNVASDDGKTFHGCYGYRWRKHFIQGGQVLDQLHEIIRELKQYPDSRRVVLAHWDAEWDCSIDVVTRDKPCNTHVYFAIRTADETYREDGSQVPKFTRYLDMTVCNRSNDLVWGMLGANVVHFSFLQEYLAACIGCEVGLYHHFTNNLHVYEERWQPLHWLRWYDKPGTKEADVYVNDEPRRYAPLVEDPATFDHECAEFVDNKDWTRNWQEPFLQDVAAPMMWAFELHKRRDYAAAFRAAQVINADDWRVAATLWLRRRQHAWEENHGQIPASID